MGEKTLWCLLALTIIHFGQVKAQAETHFCEAQVNEAVRETDSCGRYIARLSNQWNLDYAASGFDTTSISQLGAQLFEWMEELEELGQYNSDSLSVGNVPDCIFTQMQEVTKQVCCQGWQGNDCDEPICELGCGNGTCIEPYTCQCDAGFTGATCNRELLAGEGLGYCFRTLGCAGSTLDTFVGGTEQETCCDGGGGSWGGNGDGCFNCDTSFNATCNPCHPTEEQEEREVQTCMGYGTDMYRTFDSMSYAFAGECSYIAYNHGHRTFYVDMQDCEECVSCRKTYVLTMTSVAIKAVGRDQICVGTSLANCADITVTTENGWADPEFPGISIVEMGEYREISTQGLKIKFDDKFWYVTLDRGSDDPSMESEPMKGLCGNFNNDPYDDNTMMDGTTRAATIAAFGNSFKENSVEMQSCEDAIDINYECPSDGDLNRARALCVEIEREAFRACHGHVDYSRIYAQCVAHVCLRINSGADDEVLEAERCMFLTQYSMQCSAAGIIMEWRSSSLCPRECPNDMVYTECATTCMRTCSNLYSMMASECDDTCFPGCECPAGSVLHMDHCVQIESCPCNFRGKTYEAGDEFYSDCNKCTCQYGNLVCTENICPKECSIIGSNHVKTFDGLTYSHQGRAGNSYKLVEMRALNENEAPMDKGVVSISHTRYSSALNAYTRSDSLTITYVRESVETTIKFGSTIDTVTITTNATGQELETPTIIRLNGAWPDYPDVNVPAVKQATSLFAIVKAFGFQVLYSPDNAIYIKLEPYFQYNVLGLCGNYNGDVRDDLQSQNGIESTLNEVMTEYCTKDSGECEAHTSEVDDADPCSTYSQMAQTANTLCSIVKSSADGPGVFSECEQYHRYPSS